MRPSTIRAWSWFALTGVNSFSRWELHCDRMPSKLVVEVDGAIQAVDGSLLRALDGSLGVTALLDPAILPFENDCLTWRP